MALIYSVYGIYLRCQTCKKITVILAYGRNTSKLSKSITKENAQWVR